MKRIHYKQIFDKFPNIEKQFIPLIKTMKTTSFYEALEKIKSKEDKNEEKNNDKTSFSFKI